MRVTGVRTPDGRVLWVDAGPYQPEPLDAVICRTEDGNHHGTVFISPDAMLHCAVEADGLILQVIPYRQPDPNCADLPGADLPALGTRWIGGDVAGVVVRIDPIGRSMIVRQADGTEAEVPLASKNSA